MIPQKIVEEWRETNAPWRELYQVEQDLIISRVLIEIYKQPEIIDNIAFKGGTALNKLFIQPPSRYSEDIDLVQVRPGPIGSVIDAMRRVLDHWFDKTSTKMKRFGPKFFCRYQSVDGKPIKLKIEINTTEHLQILPAQKVEHAVDTEWFSGKADIICQNFDEMVATKLKALYQRRKGRDLFDIWYIAQHYDIDWSKIYTLMRNYCDHNDEKITKKLFIKNLEQKREHQDFRVDMTALLPAGKAYDFDKAFDLVFNDIIMSLPD